VKAPIAKDLPLIVILLLIAATVTAWLLGIFAYPFGILILIAAFIARLLQISSQHADDR